MKLWHGVAILVLGYFLGAYFGSYGVGAIDKVKSAI